MTINIRDLERRNEAHQTFERLLPQTDMLALADVNRLLARHLARHGGFRRSWTILERLRLQSALDLL